MPKLPRKRGLCALHHHPLHPSPSPHARVSGDHRRHRHRRRRADRRRLRPQGSGHHGLQHRHRAVGRHVRPEGRREPQVLQRASPCGQPVPADHPDARRPVRQGRVLDLRDGVRPARRHDQARPDGQARLDRPDHPHDPDRREHRHLHRAPDPAGAQARAEAHPDADPGPAEGGRSGGAPAVAGQAPPRAEEAPRQHRVLHDHREEHRPGHRQAHQGQGPGAGRVLHPEGEGRHQHRPARAGPVQDDQRHPALAEQEPPWVLQEPGQGDLQLRRHRLLRDHHGHLGGVLLHHHDQDGPAQQPGRRRLIV